MVGKNINKLVKLIGVPIDLGASKLGVDMGPAAIRYAGIIDALRYTGFDFHDIGDLKVIQNFKLDQLPVHERQNLQLDETT